MKYVSALSETLHTVLIIVLLHNVTDKKLSDDQINSSRLFSSNDKLLPLLTMVPSSLREAAVCEAAAA